MTQKSRPQAGNKVVNPTYIDAGPWSRDEWAERMYAVYTGDENTANERTQLRGVVPTFDNMLVVGIAGGPAVPVNVQTGAGFVGGSFLFNSAQVSFNPALPGIASRTDKVVLVENNTNAAYDGTASGVVLYFPTDLTDYSGASSLPSYTARLAILRGDAVTGNPTALIQTADYWMIELARYNVSNAGIFSTLVDNREFIDIETIVGVATAENDTVKDAAIIGTAVNNGVGADGLGVGILARLENDAGDLESAGRQAFVWADAANGSEDAIWKLYLSSGNSLNLSGTIRAPTTASAEGNARGDGAVEFQQLRGNVAHVASGDYSTISGGYSNTASDDYGVIGGGRENDASGDGATIGGGGWNWISNSDFSVIAGGGGDDGGAFSGNRILGGSYNAIVGGIRNSINTNAAYSVICGGRENDISVAQNYAAIVGGTLNSAGTGGFIGAGNTNTATGLYSAIGCGLDNNATGDYSVVPGGYDNTADGDYTWAGGRQADTNSFDGVFIWADSEAAAFTADRANQFKVRASGGAYFSQNSGTGAIATLELNQEDDSEEMINFIVNGTGAGYPVDTATAVGAAYARLRIAVNGTFKYIQLYDA